MHAYISGHTRGVAFIDHTEVLNGRSLQMDAYFE